MVPGGAEELAKAKARFEAFKPYKPSRYAKQESLEARGLKRLTEPQAASKAKSLTHKVRWFYTSEGGERLCVDSEPMGMAAAHSLGGQRYDMAADVEVYSIANGPTTYHDKTRLVVLPSQRAEPVETSVAQEPSDRANAIAEVKAILESVRQGIAELQASLAL